MRRLKCLGYEVTVRKTHPFEGAIRTMIKNHLEELSFDPAHIGITGCTVQDKPQGLLVTIECYRPHVLVGKKGIIVRGLAAKISKGLNCKCKVKPITTPW